MIDIYFVEIGISFFFMGFITWYGTGLDDLLLMSIIFKNRSRSQKIKMFSGNVLAVGVILGIAGMIAYFSEGIDKNSWLLRLPGVIPMVVGFLEIRNLVNKREKGGLEKLSLSKERFGLFLFAFFLYIFNSMDDLIVTVTIFLSNNEWLRIFSYSIGFVLGASLSLWLASKFSKVTKKVVFLEFLAPIVLIVIGALIVGGVLHR